MYADRFGSMVDDCYYHNREYYAVANFLKASTKVREDGTTDIALHVNSPSEVLAVMTREDWDRIIMKPSNRFNGYRPFFMYQYIKDLGLMPKFLKLCKERNFINLT